MITKERIEFTKAARKGFTLIEILIVVAIIAILASVVLVGLGPTQSLGRDARRVSDLHEVQNGLELYYNKNGAYPVVTTAAGWAGLGTDLTTGANAPAGINGIPNDPSSGAHYNYGTDAAGTTYILEAGLENGTGGPWQGYTTPTNIGSIVAADDTLGAAFTCTAATKQYCVTL